MSDSARASAWDEDASRLEIADVALGGHQAKWRGEGEAGIKQEVQGR